MSALIAVEDVAVTAGRELTEDEKTRLPGIIAQLSAAFTREAFGGLAGYGFGSGTVTHRVEVVAGQARLPFANVTAVEDVRTDNGSPVRFRWDDYRPGYVHVRARTGTYVAVTYSWQLDHPDGLTELLAAAALRILQIPATVAQGATSVTATTGPFSQTTQFATWAQGGQAMLAPAEIAVARALRPAKIPRTRWQS